MEEQKIKTENLFNGFQVNTFLSPGDLRRYADKVVDDLIHLIMEDERNNVNSRGFLSYEEDFFFLQAMRDVFNKLEEHSSGKEKDLVIMYNKSLCRPH